MSVRNELTQTRLGTTTFTQLLLFSDVKCVETLNGVDKNFNDVDNMGGRMMANSELFWRRKNFCKLNLSF